MNATENQLLAEPDAALLARFASARDEAAFAELVRRHGLAVLGTCRRVCGNSLEAEDAAQAVFLALARKAGALSREARASLAPWLHRVAVCVARDGLRAERARRHREQEAAAMAHIPEAAHENAGADARANLPLSALLPWLDAAIDELPEKYRAAVVLHHLEGHSHQAAAERLGCKPSAFSMRLTRGRELLRENLARRCAVVSLSALGACLAQPTGADLPASFVAATAQAALAWMPGTAAAAAGGASASPKAAALAQGALKMFFVQKLKFAAASGLAAFVAVAITAGVALNLRAAEATPAPDRSPAPKTADQPAPPADPNAAPAQAPAATETLTATDGKAAREAFGSQGVLLIRDAARWKDLRDRMAKAGLAVKAKDLLEPDFATQALVCVFKYGDEGNVFSVRSLRGDDVAMSYIIYKKHAVTEPQWKAIVALVPRAPQWTVTVSTFHPMNGGAHPTAEQAELEYSATFDAVRGDVVDGLAAALTPKAAKVKAGDPLLVEFRLDFRDGAQVKQAANYAAAPKSAWVWDGKYSNGYRNHAFQVRTPAGETLWLQPPVQDKWEKNAPHPVEVTPAQPYVLPNWQVNANFKSLKELGLDTTKPGTYRITGIYMERAGKSTGMDATQDMWGGCIASSPIDVVVE